MDKTHRRVVINVSREPDEADIVTLAKAVSDQIEHYGLGATFARTLGIWDGVVEEGVEVKITYPLEGDWAQAGRDAVEDTLFTLRLLLPTQKFFQVEKETVFMGEWDTRLRRFSE